MDELRSLEGMSRLMPNSKKQHDKPQITRALSLMPHKIKRTALQIIKSSSEDVPEISIRSYSSRGQAVPSEFKEEEETKFTNHTQPEITVNSPLNLSLPLMAETKSATNTTDPQAASNINGSKNINLLCINELLSSENSDNEEVDDDGFHLLSQLSVRSFSDFGGGDFALGGLNMDLMENADDDAEDEWYNDQILAEEINISFSPQADNEEEKQLQIKISTEPQEIQKGRKTITDIERFPHEEFKDYPPTNANSNKEIGADVYVIGSGSFGIVVKSFHLLSCETVAIKQCRISSDDKLLALFIAEAEYYEMFTDSEYIITMLGFGRHEENSRLCIALEYMDLHSITQNIDYQLNELQLSYIAFAILCALHTVHKMKCIHNDIKPDNILISTRGDVKLTDFGCCVQMDNNEYMTDNICGSKQYYAPEKWLISPPKYNTASDIWSFGVTFYEIITLTMNSVREFGYSESPQLKHENQVLCDFVDKMVKWKADERWNASKLLNHPYLSENKSNAREQIPFVKDEVNKKQGDLSFMIDALIEHYSNEHFFDNKKESKSKQFTDTQKIINLCKHSGCTEKEVNAVIRFAVDKAKSEIQKNTTH